MNKLHYTLHSSGKFQKVTIQWIKLSFLLAISLLFINCSPRPKYYNAWPIQMMELPPGVDYSREGITLPKEAVSASRLPEKRYEFFVWVVDPQTSRVRPLKVIPLAVTGNMIRIASPELKAGMVIARNKARILREGIRVRPEEKE